MATSSVDASSTSSITRKKPNGGPNLSNMKLNALHWEDDELALRWAAGHSRLYADRLTSQEAHSFPDVLDSKSSLQLYLFIRNKIVQIWQLESNVEVTVENVTNQICAPYNSDKVLIKRVFGYLLRYGYINYGIFHRLKDFPQLTSKKKIVVIGGGLAGITAYLQLMNFGFEVVMIEGRTRLGGRCHTYSSTKAGSFGASIDLGANIIYGIKGNPLIQLLRQISVTPDKLRIDCPIYDEQGKEMDERKDKLVFQAFRRIVKCSRYLTHNVGISEIDGKPLSLQKSYDAILDLLEYRMTKRRYKFWQAYANLVSKAQLLHNEILIYANVIVYLGGVVEAEFARMANLENENGPVEEDDERNRRDIVFRCQQRDLIEAFKRHTSASERLRALQTTIRDLSRQEPSEVYMNVRDRRLLDFHYASMENTCGTSLSNISARHYDFGNMHKMSGSNMTLREGIGELVERYGNRIYHAEKTKLGSVVDTIEYNKNGVNIAGFTARGRFEEKCDAVLVTVPLGLLKGGLEVRPGCPRKADNKGPAFLPPLPEKNANAIRKMGFGSTNKIVFVFDKPFWNTEINNFGHLNSHKGARGEMFVFSTCPQQNILSATFSGTAAELDVPNAVIIRNAMSVLQSIFGTGIPKMPTEVVLTRWNLDAMSLGISSHIPPGYDPSLFDDISDPVKAVGVTGEREGPEKVFFAGEHTCRRYGGTLQGAMLSGMREAARIADLFLGCPFARSESGPVEEECVMLDDSDDEGPVMLSSDGDEDVKYEEPPTKMLRLDNGSGEHSDFSFE